MGIVLKRGWTQPYPNEPLFVREINEPRELSAQLRVKESTIDEGRYYWVVSPSHSSKIRTTASMKVMFDNPREAIDKADEHYRKELKRLKGEE